MSLTSLPSSLRASTAWRLLGARSFSSTSSQRASVLFALGALSNSRETQHFNKLSNLSRIEHSPPLKLIKQSEVDPFPLPSPPPRPAFPVIRKLARSTAAWDDKALKVGREVLTSHARQYNRLQRALERATRREARKEQQSQKERAQWQAQALKMRQEMRSAGVAILLSIGAATALATWRFWPQHGAATVDSGEMGRRLAERAQRHFSLTPAPAVSAARREAAVAAPASALPDAATSALPAAPEPALALPASTPVSTAQPPQKSWWKGLFWKQQ